MLHAFTLSLRYQVFVEERNEALSCTKLAMAPGQEQVPAFLSQLQTFRQEVLSKKNQKNKAKEVKKCKVRFLQMIFQMKGVVKSYQIIASSLRTQRKFDDASTLFRETLGLKRLQNDSPILNSLFDQGTRKYCIISLIPITANYDHCVNALRLLDVAKHPSKYFRQSDLTPPPLPPPVERQEQESKESILTQYKQCAFRVKQLESGFSAQQDRLKELSVTVKGMINSRRTLAQFQPHKKDLVSFYLEKVLKSIASILRTRAIKYKLGGSGVKTTSEQEVMSGLKEKEQSDEQEQQGELDNNEFEEEAEEVYEQTQQEYQNKEENGAIQAEVI